MTDDDHAPTTRWNPTSARYEISRDGDVAGSAAFTMRDGVHVFDHTVVAPSYRGQGLAGDLVEAAIADVVAKGGTFAATCSYVVRWLERHHAYDAARVDPPP